MVCVPSTSSLTGSSASRSEACGTQSSPSWRVSNATGMVVVYMV